MPAAVDIATLSRRIADYPIVSCDVFDTTLTRILARPEDVLLAVGARALARGLVTCAPEAFREYRIEAERAARQQAEAVGFDEVRIAEIYTHLEACGVITEVAALAELEIAVEHAVCRPNEVVRAAIASRDPTQRLIFVSDSPLPGAWIAGLLRDAGYGDECRVFSSADIRLSKHTGRLFRHVIQTLGCSARDIIHIGDNPVSDVARADEAGIAALYVPRVRLPPETDRTAAAHWLVRLTHSHRRASDAAKATPTTRRTSRPCTPDGSALYRYASLLLIGFTLFVLTEARRQGIRRIYFLARDGYLPLALAKRLLLNTKDQFEVGYLHVSRRSVVLPTMVDDMQRFAEEVASNLSGRPINLAFNCLGVPSDETSRMLREIDIDPDATVDGPSGLKRVRRLFDGQRELIRTRLLDQRNSAISYLRQSGFLEPGPRLVVDVGWKGSTQRALSRLTGLPTTDIAGCYLGLLPQAMSAELSLDRARGYLFSFGHPKPRMDLVLDGYVVPELFFSAPHGSVLNYVEKDGRTEPVHAVEEEPGGSIRSQTSAAIMEHCLREFDALDGILDGAWPNTLDPLSALLDIEGLLSRPQTWEVEAINAIPFINGTGGEWNFVAANKMPFHQLIRQPQAAVRRFQNSPWRSGAVRISLPWPIPAMTFHEFCYKIERVRRIFKYG